MRHFIIETVLIIITLLTSFGGRFILFKDIPPSITVPQKILMPLPAALDFSILE